MKHSPPQMKTCLITIGFVALACLLAMPPELEAGVLQKVIRQTSKVADDVPLRPMEETMSNPGTRKMAQEVMESTRKLDGTLPYSRQLIREIQVTSGVMADPSVLKALENLDDAGLEVVMLANRGAKNLITAVPDIARRADILRQADAKTLCVLGRFDDLAEEAQSFQQALKNPAEIPSPEGMRRVTLDDFGAFFTKFGQKGHDFWMNEIKPNWKLWAGGTALAVILMTPEEDLDKAIEAVGWAAGKFVHVGEKVSEETVDVVEKGLEGTGKIAQKSILAVLRGFFSTWLGCIIGFVGFALLVLYIISNKAVQNFIRWIDRMITSTKKFLSRKRS